MIIHLTVFKSAPLSHAWLNLQVNSLVCFKRTKTHKDEPGFFLEPPTPHKQKTCPIFFFFGWSSPIAPHVDLLCNVSTYRTTFSKGYSNSSGGPLLALLLLLLSLLVTQQTRGCSSWLSSLKKGLWKKKSTQLAQELYSQLVWAGLLAGN